jgi:hypothetical protein
MSVWLWVDRSLGEGTLETVNMALCAVRLPEHRETVEPHSGVPWRWEIGGYGCFYHLRRVAAYAALGQGMPRPTMEFAEIWRDPVLKRFYRQFKVKRPRAVSVRTKAGGEFSQIPPWLGRSGSPYAHLMHHVAEFGYYLPIAFPEIIVVYPPKSGWAEPIGIGSSYSLQQECAELAARLEFPPEIELQELDRLRRQATEVDNQSGWQRYALECFVCKALLVGAELSIRSGCALTFG